jgi:hypothetical protein
MPTIQYLIKALSSFPSYGYSYGLHRWISPHSRASKRASSENGIKTTASNAISKRNHQTMTSSAFVLRDILAGAMTPPTSPACQESSAVPGSKKGTAVRGELLHRLLLSL